MKKKYNILIIEPAVIVQEGISSLIKLIDTNIIITCANSLSDSFELSLAKPFRIVLINPILFNNSRKKLHKFSDYFKNTIQLGLISTFFNKSLCNTFSDCIYLNDNRDTIIDTLTKFLLEKQVNNSLSEKPLSDRETDVLKLLARGKTNKEIAGELFISVHTVISHRKKIIEKLGIKSSAAMAIYAVSNKIIDLDDDLGLFQ